MIHDSSDRAFYVIADSYEDSPRGRLLVIASDLQRQHV